MTLSKIILGVLIAGGAVLGEVLVFTGGESRPTWTDTVSAISAFIAGLALWVAYRTYSIEVAPVLMLECSTREIRMPVDPSFVNYGQGASDNSGLGSQIIKMFGERYRAALRETFRSNEIAYICKISNLGRTPIFDIQLDFDIALSEEGNKHRKEINYMITVPNQLSRIGQINLAPQQSYEFAISNGIPLNMRVSPRQAARAVRFGENAVTSINMHLSPWTLVRNVMQPDWRAIAIDPHEN